MTLVEQKKKKKPGKDISITVSVTSYVVFDLVMCTKDLLSEVRISEGGMYSVKHSLIEDDVPFVVLLKNYGLCLLKFFLNNQFKYKS